jgi:hypothetical protein
MIKSGAANFEPNYDVAVKLFYRMVIAQSCFPENFYWVSF